VVDSNGGNQSFATYNTIANGINNCICNCFWTYPWSVEKNTILGGDGNGICQDRSGQAANFYAHTILGGQNNKIACPKGATTSLGHTIWGGCFNTIGGSYGNTIWGGACNCIGLGANQDNLYNTIAGGCLNTICGVASKSGIFGACNKTINATNDTQCMDAISKTSGTFAIPHPDPEKTKTHTLYHSFVESPTAGENIYRYEIVTQGNIAILELPSYYNFLNINTQIKISPKNHFGKAYGEINADQTCITFCSNCDGAYNVLIFGTRKDPDALYHWQGAEVFKHNHTNDVLVF
jgi:hypothetical protein